MNAKNFQVAVTVAITACLLLGCATAEPKSAKDFLKPILREPKSEIQASTAASSSANSTLVKKGPSPDVTSGIANVSGSALAVELQGESRTLSVNAMPMPTFINEVFGEQLDLSFTLDPAVQKLQDLVTLRLTQEVTPSELFVVAQKTLAAYGVAIVRQDGVLVFSMNRSVNTAELPLVISGRTLPEVPQSHRPVFMFVPLSIISNAKLIGWLNKALAGKEITFEGVPDANSILMHGKPSVVEQALAMIDIFDQPIMRGKYSRVIEPAYSQAKELADDVVSVLRVEGFDATLRPPLGGVILLPLKIGNQIVAFSADEEVLDHVVDWIRILDQRQAMGIEKGVFYHPLRNATADDVVDVMNKLTQVDDEAKTQSKFIADSSRNAIIYSGSGQAWSDYLSTIKQMDRPTPAVLVEVLLVEVTLNDQESNGVEFLARSGESTFSTLGGLSIGASGLNMTFDRAGETRAVLNAFYKNSRANIKSRPRLLVKSGEEASIDVGNEIPVITSTSQSTDGGDAPVLQSIQYRKTGVILTVKPIVHSSGYVDITVSQELSEAQQTSTSSIDSPTIFRRKLETTVTLRDGGSVLLGGLISQSVSNGVSGVSGIGKIPLLGKLFQTNTQFDDRTELMMLIIPYILETPDEAARISAKALELLELK